MQQEILSSIQCDIERLVEISERLSVENSMLLLLKKWLWRLGMFALPLLVLLEIVVPMIDLEPKLKYLAPILMSRLVGLFQQFIVESPIFFFLVLNRIKYKKAEKYISAFNSNSKFLMIQKTARPKRLVGPVGLALVPRASNAAHSKGVSFSASLPLDNFFSLVQSVSSKVGVDSGTEDTQHGQSYPQRFLKRWVLETQSADNQGLWGAFLSQLEVDLKMHSTECSSADVLVQLNRDIKNIRDFAKKGKFFGSPLEKPISNSTFLLGLTLVVFSQASHLFYAFFYNPYTPIGGFFFTPIGSFFFFACAILGSIWATYIIFAPLMKWQEILFQPLAHAEIDQFNATQSLLKLRPVVCAYRFPMRFFLDIVPFVAVSSKTLDADGLARRLPKSLFGNFWMKYHDTVGAQMALHPSSPEDARFDPVDFLRVWRLNWPFADTSLQWEEFQLAVHSLKPLTLTDSAHQKEDV